jgi:hypothetical protein
MGLNMELSQPRGCAANKHWCNLNFSALSATRREPAERLCGEN